MHHLIHALTQGKLIAYPTETVWGLGCDAFCERAVMALLHLKNRSPDKGLIVLTDTTERILPFLRPLPNDRQADILHTWQTPQTNQATTWLFPVPDGVSIPTWLTGTHHSLAIRVINHPTIADLCQKLISPKNPYGFLVSTSCNPSGLPPASDLDGALAYFGGRDDVVFLDDKTLGYQKPSQIRCAISADIIRT